jgi:hypothetical protein
MTPKAVWYLMAAAIVIAAGIGVRRLARRSEPGRELAELVLTALGSDWADRFSTDETTLRRALVENEQPDLLSRIDAEVGVVDIKLTRPTGGRGTITAAVLCEYPEDRQKTAVTLDLGWIDTPADVRAEFLRTGESDVFRKWTAATAGAGR